MDDIRTQDDDETTICDVLDEDGLPCAREFPDELAWQEHFEDSHLGAEESGRWA